MVQTVDIALYVHFPWCVRKCPYCDFNSHATDSRNGELPEAEYVSQLLQDLDADLALLASKPRITSIFMGGGTPSLFRPESIAHLLAGVGERAELAENVEITMEANPGTTDAGRFTGYRQAGINRLSLGGQSFSDASLQQLGRIHSAGDIITAFEAARQAGIDNINIDLMHGLPGQTLAAAMTDLDQALALAPQHLSWYQLTIEPNTAFYRYPPNLPDEDHLWAIYAAGLERLEQAGLQRYEVSAFSLAGHRCAHNLNYWQFGDYLGIGAGAHGKLRHGGDTLRTTKTRAPKDYLRAPNRRSRRITADDMPLEFLMNTLRLNQGFAWSDFERLTGLPATTLDAFVQQGHAKGLLTLNDSGARPTARGIQFLNELLLLIA